MTSDADFDSIISRKGRSHKEEDMRDYDKLARYLEKRDKEVFKTIDVHTYLKLMYDQMVPLVDAGRYEEANGVFFAYTGIHTWNIRCELEREEESW